jgi:hypothetical protein
LPNLKILTRPAGSCDGSAGHGSDSDRSCPPLSIRLETGVRPGHKDAPRRFADAAVQRHTLTAVHTARPGARAADISVAY